MMHLDRQGLAVTYSEATSRPPRKTEAPSSKLTPGDVHLKLVAREKKRRLPGPHWNEYAGRNKRRTPPTRNVRNRSSIGPDDTASCVVWRERGPGDRRSITVIAELRELVRSDHRPFGVV